MAEKVVRQPERDMEHADDRPWHDLAALGTETPAQRKAKRIMPWVMSFVLHVGVIALGFVITWTVVMMTDERPPTIIADFDAMTFDPVAVVDHSQTIEPDRVAPADMEIAAELPDDPLLELEVEVSDLLPDAVAGPTHVDFAPPPVRGSASFLGISTSNAQRIVYIIDASGSKIPYLRIILQELARSLDGLTDEQSFAVIFFQRNEYVMVPPQRRLIPATDSERRRVLQWIDDNVIPAGRSNPLAAFEVALRLNPDVIFLLSSNITGSGIFEVDQSEVLARLDELNPADRLTGHRPTQINCIQFLDPDPLNTLRKIAEHHGGPRSYKFLSRAELGLAVQ